MSSKLAAVVCLVTACLLNGQQHASAASFSLQPADAYGPVSVLIKGQIQAGDFGRFQTFLLQPDHLKAFSNYVWLDSTGGNLAEAMKFATLFEKSSASVVVGPDGKCYSACFMMFASGVDRWLYPFGELGVHQVSVEFPAGLPTPDKAARNGMVQAVTNNVSAYLASQGIPQTLVTKMQETPASEMFVINTLMVKREGWQRVMALQPQFLAAVEQACSRQPDTDAGRPSEPQSAWTACKIDFQTRRTKQFITAELELLDAGSASLLFAQDKSSQARAAVEAMKK
jgi:ATP-dependent protease ClpP protease subunit